MARPASSAPSSSTQPPSLETGEVTDKGTLNQKAVLASRAALVDALYADPAPDAALVVPSDGG